jgi:PEP-CTERM motif
LPSGLDFINILLTKIYNRGVDMKKCVLMAAVVAAISIAAPANAAEVIASLPDYNGPVNSSGFPINLGTVGTFTYGSLTGSTITAAFLEGTYGTADFPTSTASFDASVDGTSVTVCALLAPCFFGSGSLVPFSIALPSSSFAALLDGSASLGITQTSQTIVRYGTPTLRIDYTPGAVPEPATWAMMLLGFAGIGLAYRKRPRQTLRTV